VIGLDTNVLVRYITQGDPVNSSKATNFIERHLSTENPGYVSIIALVETVWVLGTSYGFADWQIVPVIEQMLGVETLVVENAEDVSIAVMAVKRRTGDFTDVLLGAKCVRAGCTHTVTFDKRASRMRGFASVPGKGIGMN
jgi:predicted nucleic-acid-binding protein